MALASLGACSSVKSVTICASKGGTKICGTVKTQTPISRTQQISPNSGTGSPYVNVTTAVTGDYTVSDIQNTDFSQGYAQIQLTDASVSGGGAATVTLQIVNSSGNVVTQSTFSGYFSGDVIYANDPANVKQWVLNNFSNGDSLTMTGSVSVQPAQGATQYSAVGTAMYNGTEEGSAYGTFSTGGTGGCSRRFICRQKGPQRGA